MSSPASYNTYLSNFLRDFYVAIIKLVDKALKRVDTSVRGNMATEIHKHLYFCHENAKKFLGRENELYKVSEQKTPENHKILLGILAKTHSVWKSLKMSHLIFYILAFSANFFAIKTILSGNTVWPKASGFRKVVKMDHFWHF